MSLKLRSFGGNRKLSGLRSNVLTTAALNLLEPPAFVRRLESRDVVKGTELMLESQVSGSAPFTVSMYKNGKPIRNDKKHRITLKEELIAVQVLAVGQGDVGTYQCTVENEVGGVSCDCQVTLKGLYSSPLLKKQCFKFSYYRPTTEPTRCSNFHSKT